MTIEQLIACDAATLEAMSNEELLKHFEPMLNITRPERQTVSTHKKEQQIRQQNPQLAKGVALAKSLGIDVSAVFLPTLRSKKK